MLILASRPCSAFDGQRRGFLLGFGAGIGSVAAGEVVKPDIIGLQTDLKLGWGISDQWQVLYSGKQIWWSSEDVFVTGAFPSVGAAYYLKPNAPSIFVTGGVGGWILGAAARDIGVGVAFLGPGGFVGAGYEIGRHICLELDAGVGALPSADAGFGHVALTLSILGY